MLQKRTSETWPYDFDLTRLLGADETITSVVSMSAEPVLSTPITFGTASINTVPAQYPHGTAKPGKVIQVEISGGIIAAGLSHQLCTLRLKFNKSGSSGTGEATAYLDLVDSPNPP